MAEYQRLQKRQKNFLLKKKKQNDENDVGVRTVCVMYYLLGFAICILFFWFCRHVHKQKLFLSQAIRKKHWEISLSMGFKRFVVSSLEIWLSLITSFPCDKKESGLSSKQLWIYVFKCLISCEKNAAETIVKNTIKMVLFVFFSYPVIPSWDTTA